MAGLVEAVRAHVDEACIATRCSAEGCWVNMTGAPQPNLLIKMDCDGLGVEDGDSKCDFMFISDDGDWVVALELKRGKPDASAIVEQLRAGARFAERIVPRDVNVQFLPLAVYGGKAHSTELRKFRQSQISFRGERVQVELLKCRRRIVEKLR